MTIRTNRVDVFVLVDAPLGTTFGQAKEALQAVLSYNGDEKPLARVTMTSQYATTTKWSDLLCFVDWAISIGQKPGVRIFGDLIGITPQLTQEIADRGVKMYGEWFGPSLDETGVLAMVQQGITKSDARAILAGIQMALAANALTGIEFQVNRQNARYIKSFLQLCQSLNLEGHLEMQEMQLAEPRNARLAQRYRNNLPTSTQLREVCDIVAECTGNSPYSLLPPFFCPGNPDGTCSYFYRGLFLWPNGKGGLKQTVCLSDLTVVDAEFEPTPERIIDNLKHPLMALRNIQQEEMRGKCHSCEIWPVCLGGCRAMAYLASGSRYATDPNCWK